MKLKAEGKKWCEIAATFRIDTSTLFKYRQKWKRAELMR
jgi:hypothetical protein